MAWTQKLPSGNYRALYRDPTGKQQHAGTFPHQKRALAEATRREEEASLPGWRDPHAAGRKWGDWCNEWWPTRNISAGNLKNETSMRDKHVMPKWKDTPLAEITKYGVKVWAGELRNGGLAESSVKRVVSVLSASLSAAVDAEILPSNVTFRLKLPLGETDVTRYLTRKEVAKIIDAMESDADKAIVALLVGCGMRWGEMRGLHGRRIDTKAMKVRIAETWDSKMGKPKAYPKGRKIRQVPLPKWVLRRVKPFMQSGILFPHVNIDNWRKRVWDRAAAEAGVPEARIHDLRHTYASWLLQDGVSLAEVGKLLGHKSPHTTQRYAHLAEVNDERVLDALPEPKAAKPKKGKKK